MQEQKEFIQKEKAKLKHNMESVKSSSANNSN